MRSLLHTFIFALCFLLVAGNVSAQGTSSFTGIVFRDLNGDGVQDLPEEEGIPGVLVELRGGDTADELHAAVISGPDGSYTVSAADLPDASNYRLRYFYPNIAFTSSTTGVTWFAGGDPRPYARSTQFAVIGGEPIQETIDLGLVPVYETLSYSTQRALAATNWGPHNLTLPQSPTGHGVLKEVRLYINYHVLNPSVTVKNVDGEDPVTGRFQTTARFGVTTPFDSEPYNHESNYNSPDITPLLAGQEVSFSNLHSALGGVNHVYDPPYFGSFVGDDYFSVPFTSTGFSGFNGSGNFEAAVSTVSAPGIFVVYIYEEGSLPVKLAKFTARTEGETALLNWSTTEEINSANFEVERSSNGKIWNKIGTVSARGESSSLQNYSFPDASPLNGNNYYRLKMNDLDGSFAYSPIISLRSFSGKAITAATYPNPASEVVFLENVDTALLQSIDILNATGRNVLSGLTYNETQGINVSSLSKGLYLLKYTLKTGEQATIKVLINR